MAAPPKAARGLVRCEEEGNGDREGGRFRAGPPAGSSATTRGEVIIALLETGLTTTSCHVNTTGEPFRRCDRLTRLVADRPVC
jgi:hypothetical protein